MPAEAAPAPKVLGTLIIKVLNATGKSGDGKALWDDNFKQGFVKAELRAATRNVKAQSTLHSVDNCKLDFDEEIPLQLAEDAKELRLLLCREKHYQHRTSTAVVAACGLFVEPLLEACPISKVFDMYKPGGQGAGPGGRIHIYATFEAASTNTDWRIHAAGHLPSLEEESIDSRRVEPMTDDEGGKMRPRTPEPERPTPAPANGPGSSSDTTQQNGTMQQDVPAPDTGSSSAPAPAEPEPSPLRAIAARAAQENERRSKQQQPRRPRKGRGSPLKKLAIAALAVGVAAVAVRQVKAGRGKPKGDQNIDSGV